MSVPTDPPPDDGEPLESSLERGLQRDPLDAAAVARIRVAAQAEFQAQYASRRRSSHRPRFALAAGVLLVLLAGMLALHYKSRSAIVVSALRIDQGALEAHAGWFQLRTLGKGAALRVGEKFESAGNTVMAIGEGGTLRVSSGTRFSVTARNEVLLNSGRLYFDFSAGAQPFVLRTDAGSVTHLGTQFEVITLPEGMRVRVREGSVLIHAGSKVQTAEAGTEILVHYGGTVVRRSIATYGEDWAWVEAIAPEFEIENRSVFEFLGWVARETGRHVDFADEHTRELAESTRLHGSIRGLTPLQALARVTSTTTLRFEVQENVIRVSSRR